MADIQMPDIETRTAILQAKAEQSGIAVPDEVLAFIAHQVRNNIRELEGVLTKVIAYAEITGSPLDMRVVQTALSDMIRRPEKVTVERVIDVVGAHYNISVEVLCGAGRSRKVAFPRQICMYLARTETDTSFPQIGEKLGSRDHSTIVYGHDKIAGLVETDPELRREILAIKNELYGADFT
jgi:chromosomal replication initiator protein